MAGLITRRGFLGGFSAAVAVASSRTYAEAAGAGRPNLRFGVVSDLHISPAAIMLRFVKGDRGMFRPRETDILERTLGYFDVRGVDAVVFAGDIADWGLNCQFRAFVDTWEKVFPGSRSRRDGRPVERLAVLGNHDVDFRAWTVGNYATRAMGDFRMPPGEIFKTDIAGNWRRFFGDDYSPVWHRRVKGYDFVGAHWYRHGEPAPAVEPFFREHGAVLAGAKPFFYIQHPQPRGTCLGGGWASGDGGEATAALSRFPNAVAFSGHSHCPLTFEKNIWQGEFTSIATASLSYLSLGKGRDNGPAGRHGRGKDGQTAMKRIRGNVHETGETFAAHGMVVSVHDDFLEIERRDFVTERRVGPNWVVSVPVGGFSPFAYLEREKNGRSPAEFPDGAEVRVTRTDSTVHLEFPAAPVTDHTEPVLDYRVVAEAVDGGGPRELFTRYVFRPDVLFEQTVDTVTADFPRKLLPEKGKVRFRVSAREAFGHENRPIGSELRI